MRIVTWNINSLRLRLEHVKLLKERLQPDILCLQETKVNDPEFPMDALKQMGFKYIYFRGEKSYNGMATLSMVPLKELDYLELAGSDAKRHQELLIGNDIRLHNFYVPAGGDEPDPIINPKFGYKLNFLDEMVGFFSQKTHKDSKQIILGDLNTAPLEHDVWSHRQLLKIISHTPIEVEKMNKLQATLNWVDVSRHFVPEPTKLYSWWSYRNKDWRKSDRGRRLDHIWVTPQLKSALISSFIMKEARDFTSPSDHVPVIMDLAV